MLRFYDHETTPTVDLTLDPGHEPPRPALTPRPRQLAISETTDLYGEAFYDGGIHATRVVRFVSSETQGLLTFAEVEQLLSLYEQGGAFFVDTDLLVGFGEASRSYHAIWVPDEPPQFPDAAHGRYYFMDLPLRLREKGA